MWLIIMIEPRTIDVLDKGFVTLLDVMGDDRSIAKAARVSYDRHDDKGYERLVTFLMKHEHTSPFEMVEFKFMVKAPMFIARQWFRHRTGSYNEISLRYTKPTAPEFYIPTKFRGQALDNKQASVEGTVDESHFAELAARMEEAYASSVKTYEWLLEQGVAREQARSVLPVGIYTKYIYKTDLHNLLRFIRLRAAPNAQWEIQQYARAIVKLITPYVPVTMKAFSDFVVKDETVRAIVESEIENVQ